MSIPFIDINSWEFLALIVLALVLIGPQRLPEYVAKLRGWIRQAQQMAEGAKTQLKEQMGPEFEEVNWRQYDPRQYDPRRIVREALFDDADADVGAELGLSERRDPSPHGATAASVATATAGSAVSSGVGAEGSGAGGSQAGGVGAESPHATGQPHVPRSFVDNTFHPDRSTPFDVEAT